MNDSEVALSDDTSTEVIVETATSTPEVEVVQDGFTPELQPVVAKQEEELDSAEIRKRIVDLSKQIGTYYAELCPLVRKVQLKALYVNWGFPTFKEYCLRELNLKPTKAMYLAMIEKNLVEQQGGDRGIFEQVMALGWSKAKDLARVVTRENLEFWLEKGRNLGVDALIKEIKAEISKKIPDDPKEALEQEGEVEGTPIAEEIKSVTFSFPYNDYLTLSKALDKIASVNPDAGKGSLLALICSDFLGSNPDEESAEDSKMFALSLIRKVSEIHGWTAMVMDQKENFLCGFEEFQNAMKEALIQATSDREEDEQAEPVNV